MKTSEDSRSTGGSSGSRWCPFELSPELCRCAVLGVLALAFAALLVFVSLNPAMPPALTIAGTNEVARSLSQTFNGAPGESRPLALGLAVSRASTSRTRTSPDTAVVPATATAATGGSTASSPNFETDLLTVED